jgi:hypothetical protein
MTCCKKPAIRQILLYRARHWSFLGYALTAAYPQLKPGQQAQRIDNEYTAY